MARTIAPGTPAETKAQHFDVKMPDFSLLEKMGDAKINAGIKNAELYAEALITSESQKLYNQFKNDPINLTNALSKVPDMLTDVPEEVRKKMTQKLMLNSMALVQKAENNQTVLQDKQNEQNANLIIANSKQEILPAYMNLLQNNIAPAEEKQPAVNDIFVSHLDSLQTLSDLKDSNGLDVYTAEQKKAIRNVYDVELQGFKRFVDTMIMNDNDNLDKTKDYYQKHVLASERFMAENYMNQETYEKARKYIQDQMKARDVQVKKLKFNQSVKEAMELQLVDLPSRVKTLKESGHITPTIIDTIEKTNVKFSNIDPAKAELPTTMLEMLEIVNNWNRLPVADTPEQKLEILAQGTMALDSMADFGQKYGLSPKSVNQARQMVVMKEQDMRYSEMLDNFGRITQAFGQNIPDMRKKLNYIRMVNGAGKILGVDYKVPSGTEEVKLLKLNEALAIADDAAREALRNGDMDTYNKIQAELPQTIAKIKYMGIIKDVDWANWYAHPDTPIQVGTQYVKILGFTSDGDVIVEK